MTPPFHHDDPLHRHHAEDDPRTGLSDAALRRAVADHLAFTLGTDAARATVRDRFMAVSLAVRDRLVHRWAATREAATRHDARQVVYLSAEYLVGPHLGNNLLALGILERMRDLLGEDGRGLQEVLDFEEEPGLGNGGLGRLAACYLDSLSTLEVPATGYGIRYEFGIFDQLIRDGQQVEVTDTWLRLGNPWEMARPELAVDVAFGGRTETWSDETGRMRSRWIPENVVTGIPYDTFIPGHGVATCNTLRLWRSVSKNVFDFAAFNAGDFHGAVSASFLPETVTKVIYPNDERDEGKRLRLMQQFFFVTCALQDLLRAHLVAGHPISTFHERHAIQLNDTHPSVAVAELMRLLVDQHRMEWHEAWLVTHQAFSYTNHTLMPEALETWNAGLFGSLLPRHLEIIYEINRRFVDDVRAMRPGDEALAARLSIYDAPSGRLRMAHLATVGSHAVNGVSALHSELLHTTVLGDFFSLWPEKFTNVTNGVSPRRFLALCNPGLSALITDVAGPGWVRDLDLIARLEPLAGDAAFRDRWRAVKLENKRRLAARIKEATGEIVDPESLFDVQVKRIHEYKRQTLNALHALTLYRRLKDDPGLDAPPRTIIFGGKAAPGYWMAKLIIRFACAVGSLVNRDPAMKGRLRVIFFPDFNVKNGQVIYPAADLSEQISVAGKEASGTGNMKLSMNGALTIGTYDGANIEIRDQVGADNFFLFGLAVDEVSELRSRGWRPRDRYESDDELRAAIDLLARGVHAGAGAGTFAPLVEHLLNYDEYLVLADYRSYVDCQTEAGRAFRDADEWTRKSVLNSARTGTFSSDRSIREYCRGIWNAAPSRVTLA